MWTCGEGVEKRTERLGMWIRESDLEASEHLVRCESARLVKRGE